MTSPTRSRTSFASLLIGIIAVGALVASAALFFTTPGSALLTRLTTRWVAPQSDTSGLDSAREAEAWGRLGASFEGRITWSSNRSGNHELYELALPAGELRQLTDHPNVDFGGRYSPDGERLVFMRSRREWVSFREKAAWDVFILDLESGREQRIARRGYHPTWGPGGESVVFHRGAQVIQLDLATDAETVLFDADVSGEGREIWDPELHPGGDRLALALGRYGAIVSPGPDDDYTRLTPRHVCQTTWIPGTDELLWMESEGNGGTRVMRGDADGNRSEVFMDLPGDRSHEYFPKLSQDGEWLVWAASAEGHEHDRADYEIYAWRVGTAWDTALRLTYFPGNDQWPDIYVD